MDLIVESVNGKNYHYPNVVAYMIVDGMLRIVDRDDETKGRVSVGHVAANVSRVMPIYTRLPQAPPSAQEPPG